MHPRDCDYRRPFLGRSQSERPSVIQGLCERVLFSYGVCVCVCACGGGVVGCGGGVPLWRWCSGVWRCVVVCGGVWRRVVVCGGV